MNITAEMSLHQRVGIVKKTELDHFSITDPDQMHPVVLEWLVCRSRTTDRTAKHRNKIGTAQKLTGLKGIQRDIRGQLAKK